MVIGFDIGLFDEIEARLDQRAQMQHLLAQGLKLGPEGAMQAPQGLPGSMDIGSRHQIENRFGLIEGQPSDSQGLAREGPGPAASAPASCSTCKAISTRNGLPGTTTSTRSWPV